MVPLNAVTLSQFALRDLINVGAQIRQIGTVATSLSEFGSQLTDYLYGSLWMDSGEPAAALTRFFITSRFDELPEDLQHAVVRSISSPAPDMKCMTLIATRGQQPDWDEVRHSRGHQVIALPNETVLNSIPMIARLMSSLGVDVGGFLQSRENIMLENRHTGVFFIPNAEGSPYIPAQGSFVAPHGIKSVVGFGDVLPGGNVFAVISFYKMLVSARTAELMSHLSLSTRVALLPHLPNVASHEAIQRSQLEMIENYEEIVLRQDQLMQEGMETLTRNSRLKSEFLANMSHEIRTPMTAILGFAEMLSRESALTQDESSNAVDSIHRNSRYLLAIINDILDMSKIEAGKMLVERVVTSLEQVIEESLSFVRPQAFAKSIELKVNFHGELPEFLQTDPIRLRQILVNLLGNAVKFTSQGSVVIDVTADVPAEIIRFDVTDSGVGMTPEQLSTVLRYDPFSQADGTVTRRFGGTGLGLSIANSLARLLGGGLTADSELNRGSTFSLRIATGPLNDVALVKLPRSAEPVRASLIRISRPKSANSTAPTDAGQAARRSLEGVRILLAEDGPDNQRLLMFHLRRSGAVVDLAQNGVEAIQAYEMAHVTGLEPQIILLDMNMPELDGYGAARQLRASGCAIPIVALTAHAMSSDRAKCIAAGCDDYLTKPIDKESLIRTCERLVSTTLVS